MSDFLMRDGAPLSGEEWDALDKVIVATARQYLVGRRFIELVGPMGAGAEVVPVGTGEKRDYLKLATIEHGFQLAWRDIEASRKMGGPLELGLAANAAAQCAMDEDRMVLGGLAKAAATTAKLGDWEQAVGPLEAIVQATKALVAKGCYGPYAVVLSLDLFTKTQRVHHGMGQTVGKLIRDVAEAGIFRSPVLGDGQGMVVSLGAYNFDLVIGQDLVTAYVGNEGLDHLFLVLESLALRVKRPEAICAFK